MTTSPQTLRCPHCNGVLQAFRMPEESGWEAPCQWACFNDECPYYCDGWDWMWENYQVRASYRYRVVDRDGAHATPLPVWSKDALRDRIIEENG